MIHQFIPLDAPRYIARFFDHWQPDLALLAESDLWPNLILACKQRNVPLILVNGRLSERSFTRWRYLPKTIGTLLGASIFASRSPRPTRSAIPSSARRASA